MLYASNIRLLLDFTQEISCDLMLDSIGEKIKMWRLTLTLLRRPSVRNLSRTKYKSISFPKGKVKALVFLLSPVF